MSTMVIAPEFRFNPYPYQRIPFKALAQGVKRIILVWPRRTGKDLTLLNLAVIRSQIVVGTYFYFFPTHKQAKRVIWDGMTDPPDSFPFLSYIPNELIADLNEAELQIKLLNGSIIQLLGADSIDTSAVGTNCVGAIFSEYAIQHPNGWNYVRPILARNNGWAAFAYTPRGHNHGWDLFDRNRDNPEWSVSLLNAYTCLDHDGNRVITEAMVQKERDAGMPEEMLQQEFFCSFSGIQTGTYFADQLVQAENDDRIGNFKWNSDVPVHTVSDLGKALKFVTWFFQVYNDKVYWIDYNALESGAIPEFGSMLKTKPYTYGKHFAPFDIKATEIGTGQTRIESARKIGIYFKPVPKLAVADRVEAGRRVMPISYFHKPAVGEGIKTLLNYRREYDEMKKEYSDVEVHDWASHGGSAYTYGCVAIRQLLNSVKIAEIADTDFDEFENKNSYDSFDPMNEE